MFLLLEFWADIVILMSMCSQCVMPESPPEIVLSPEGICNLCLSYRATQSAPPSDKHRDVLETDLLKLIAKAKGKGPYDCLVMCSGGKDSTAALYYMVKRYGLRTLAFTFDHGFESDEALGNVNRAVEILGVDFMYLRSNFMKPFFSELYHSKSKAVMCHPCSIWYMQLTFDVATRYQIPLIVAGWTKGQSSDNSSSVMSKCACSTSEPEFKKMGEHTRAFIEQMRNNPKFPQFKDFPYSMEEALRQARKKSNAIVISPHWFLPYSQSEYIEVIQRELKWKPTTKSYPQATTNCDLNFLASANSLKNYGYTHYHVEMSKMIRQGLMEREEALSRLNFDLEDDLLAEIAKKL